MYKYRRARRPAPLLAVLLTLTLAAGARAARWQVMTFTEDLGRDLEELSHYCLLHDVASADVLWANNCSVQDLVPGRQIYLPASQVDMLSIWQNQGAWQPKALVKTTSAAAAERARGTATGGTKPQVPAPVPVQTPARPVNQAPAPRPVTPAPAPALPAPAQPRQTQQSQQAQQTQQKSDPVILISPEGDSLSGPMRLVVSGDRVTIVRLPQSAAPRNPALSSNFPPSLLPPFPAPGKNDKLIPRVSSSKMMWPVDGAVSSPFGRRGSRRHDGVDIPMPLGTPIRAAKDGVVAATGTNSTPGFRGYGNFVLIDHGQNLKTLYAHCSKVLASKGQRIRQGDIIAEVGRTGRASTNHVHFEVRVKDKAVDPMPYLQGTQNVKVAQAAKTPVKTQAKTPAKTPVKTPAKTPVKAPAKTKTAKK